MRRCGGDGVGRVLPVIPDGGGAATPDQEEFLLIERPDQLGGISQTARVDYDVHTAVVHGLAAYVATREGGVAGRHVALSRVVADYADHDDGPAPSPSAAVYSTEVGQYSPDGISSGDPEVLGTDEHRRVLTLKSLGVYELGELLVEVRCEDKVQRGGVRRMLEDAFSPVEWMIGFYLVLPRYHGALAKYLLVSGQQADAADTAAAGMRPLTMRLRVQCPQYRLFSMPLARPIAAGNIGLGKRRI